MPKAGPNAKARLNNLVEQVDIGFSWSVIFNIIIICSVANSLGSIKMSIIHRQKV